MSAIVGRARIALDRDGDRLLPALDPARGRRSPLSDRVASCATAFWGVFACVVAIFAAELGSLIEVVNRFGSFFYGSILGVFVLAIGWKRATGHGAFVGLIAGMGAVAVVDVVHQRRVPLAQRRRRRHGVRRRRRRVRHRPGRRRACPPSPWAARSSSRSSLVIGVDGGVVDAGGAAAAEKEVKAKRHQTQPPQRRRASEHREGPSLSFGGLRLPYNLSRSSLPMTTFQQRSSYWATPAGVERIVVADAVEGGARVVVGHADEEHPAEARVPWSGGQQDAVGFELPLVGAMRAPGPSGFLRSAGGNEREPWHTWSDYGTSGCLGWLEGRR